MFAAVGYRRVIAVILAGITVPTFALAMLSFFAAEPDDLAPRDGRLAPCPNTPNCVSSHADDQRHAIKPISFIGSAEAAMERLRRVLGEHPRTTIISSWERTTTSAGCWNLVIWSM